MFYVPYLLFRVILGVLEVLWGPAELALDFQEGQWGLENRGGQGSHSLPWFQGNQDCHLGREDPGLP